MRSSAFISSFLKLQPVLGSLDLKAKKSGRLHESSSSQRENMSETFILITFGCVSKLGGLLPLISGKIEPFKGGWGDPNLDTNPFARLMVQQRCATLQLLFLATLESCLLTKPWVWPHQALMPLCQNQIYASRNVLQIMEKRSIRVAH